MRFANVLFLVFLKVAYAHIPGQQWAEPEEPQYATYDGSMVSSLSAVVRLTAVRAVMTANQVDAYVVPSTDAHGSQYIAPTDMRRAWLSGLQGSSGSVVVTAGEALVWTDARYWEQFYLQVDTEHFRLMRQGVDLSIQNWLTTMPANSVVGLDPTTYTRTAWNGLQAALAAVNVTLTAIDQNLIDAARILVNEPAPPRPNNPLTILGAQWTGRIAREKIEELRSTIEQRNAVALVLSALDDIAYTLNLRGSDIPYNPVFFSYLIIRSDLQMPDNVILFWGDSTLTADVEEHLASELIQITVRPYDEFFDYLKDMSASLPDGSSIWLSQDGSQSLFSAVESAGSVTIQSSLSPVQLMKAIKNPVELEGFRNAHIKDGLAIVRSLYWLDKTVLADELVTEIHLSDKLEEMRMLEDECHGPSFSTIAGAGENGAIIHYSPSREGPQREIKLNEMVLIDSGGQYKDGTTDLTRTRCLGGAPTDMQRLAFTRVMKGQIALATTVFPQGTPGHTLESFARRPLWDVGLDYAHGTGHGIGHFLNVHEGPSWILSGPSATDPGISAGMIFSNEPGFYRTGEFGIRHEDVVEVIKMDHSADHPLASGLVEDFESKGALGFYTISLVPHQTACLDVSLLTDFEIKYLNDYHARVLETLGPILQERDLLEEYSWLEHECAPIGNSATILGTSSLLFFSIITLYCNMA